MPCNPSIHLSRKATFIPFRCKRLRGALILLFAVFAHHDLQLALTCGEHKSFGLLELNLVSCVPTLNDQYLLDTSLSAES